MGRDTGMRSGASGFTLVELVLATLISSLVIAIVSVSLSFSLRVWERQQNRQPSEMPDLLDLIKWQLASFDPAMVRVEGDTHFIFQGDERELTLATDRSVRAISNGVPVIARYVFDPKEKKLYYAEMPLDPYHQEALSTFLQAKPNSRDEKSWPRFYFTSVADLSFAYGHGREKSEYSVIWTDETAIPDAVLVKWTALEDPTARVQLIVPNFFFAREIVKNEGPGSLKGVQGQGFK